MSSVRRRIEKLERQLQGAGSKRRKQAVTVLFRGSLTEADMLQIRAEYLPLLCKHGAVLFLPENGRDNLLPADRKWIIR